VLERVFGPEGQAWFRVGRAPKFAMPFRWAEGSDRCDKLVLGVIGGERIEAIGWGFQWVLDGVHGGTGRPYEWEGGRPRVDQLPVLDRDGLEGLLDALGACVGARGKGAGVRGRWFSRTDMLRLSPRYRQQVNERDQQAHGAENARRLAGLRGPEPLVRRLVAAIPNGSDQGLSYEFYVAMLHALKGASGGEDWGLDVWLGWCAQWPRDRPGVNLDKWAGLSATAVRTAGFDWLEYRADLRAGEKAGIAAQAWHWRQAQEQGQHEEGGNAA
jgi:hypothetical protein